MVSRCHYWGYYHRSLFHSLQSDSMLHWVCITNILVLTECVRPSRRLSLDWLLHAATPSSCARPGLNAAPVRHISSVCKLVCGVLTNIARIHCHYVLVLTTNHSVFCYCISWTLVCIWGILLLYSTLSCVYSSALFLQLKKLSCIVHIIHLFSGHHLLRKLAHL